MFKHLGLMIDINLTYTFNMRTSSFDEKLLCIPPEGLELARLVPILHTDDGTPRVLVSH